MITKILRHFCSKEVQMMLTRLEEHPEDFDTLSESVWENLLSEVFTRGTFIEQTVTRNVKNKVFEKRRRDEFLQSIVKQTIDPKNKYDYPHTDSGNTIVGPHQIQTAQLQLQQMQQAQMRAYSNISAQQRQP